MESLVASGHVSILAPILYLFSPFLSCLLFVYQHLSLICNSMRRDFNTYFHWFGIVSMNHQSLRKVDTIWFLELDMVWVNYSKQLSTLDRSKNHRQYIHVLHVIYYKFLIFVTIIQDQI